MSHFTGDCGPAVDWTKYREPSPQPAVNYEGAVERMWPEATAEQINYRDELDRAVCLLCERYASSEASLADLYQAVEELVSYDQAVPGAAVR